MANMTPIKAVLAERGTDTKGEIDATVVGGADIMIQVAKAAAAAVVATGAVVVVEGVTGGATPTTMSNFGNMKLNV